MARLGRTRGILVGERGFVDEKIGAFGRLNRRRARPSVSGDHDLSAGPRWPNQLGWVDLASVVQRDALAAMKATPHRPFRNSELARAIGVEPAESQFFDDRKSDRRCAAVIGGKRDDGVPIASDRLSGFHLPYFHWKRHPVSPEGLRAPQHLRGAGLH